MSIISANRYGTINGKIKIVADESYGIRDIGRIMLENEQNDMAIFNAALRCDMYELKCRTEGTLLESELESLNESSAKEFLKSIVEKLKRLWGKIKGVFKNAYAMLSAYVVRNGRTFVKQNYAELKGLDGSKKLSGKVITFKKDPRGIAPTSFDFKKFAEEAKRDDKRIDLTKSALNKLINGDLGDKKIYEYLKDEYFNEPKSDCTLSGVGMSVTDMINIIDNGKVAIMNLRRVEDGFDRDIKLAITTLEKEAKQAKKDANDKDAVKTENDKLKAYQKASTAMSNAVAMYTQAAIKLTKLSVNTAHRILARAIMTRIKNENAMLMEAMLMEADDAIENADQTAETLTPEEKEEVAEILAKAAEELSNSEGSSEDGEPDAE